ncbi:MAG: glycoside hydrolase family 5 protein [Clostridiales bacterium]|nr:glycoside hydrolase family 5 protein [Clostridiales bacterium]
MKKHKRFAIISTLMVVSMLFTACSKQLPDETLPPATSAAVTSESTEASESLAIETEISETAAEEPSHGPFSTAVVTEKVVENNGQLSVVGKDIVNQNGEPIQLRGMSTYGLNGMAGFVNADTVQTLAEDWGCDVIRLAMYTEDNSDGYTQNPDKYFNQACEYMDLCIAQGVYVIIDWHILFDGDPNEHKDMAIDFFSRISAIYGEYPNVIYEICNEPNGMRYDDPDSPVDWDNTIRPYAVDVIDAIRANDPDNIILIGTSNYSRDVDIAAANPIEGENLMYTFHFYAGSHGQEMKDQLQTALDMGLPVFVSEWGTSQASGSGGVYEEESLAWLQMLEENNISWCNWSIGGSVTESSNALKFVSNVLTMEEKLAGHWPDEFISNSGLFVRSILLGTYGDEG